MIRSVAHPVNKAAHRTHSRRARYALMILLAILLGALLLGELGYFAQVGWLPLGNALLHTTLRLVLAYGIALFIGAGIALLVGWSRFSDGLFPVFDVLQNIPSFALIPLFIYFFGYTDKMIVLFAVSSIVWPILFSTLSAIKSAHADLNDAATIFGARGLRRIAHYLVPLSLPAVLTGSIVGIAIGWESVIGAEIIASISGFGSFIKDASGNGIGPSAVAGTLGILVIVFLVNRLVWAPLLAESAKRYAE